MQRPRQIVEAPSDRELIERIVRGEKRAYRTIVERYEPAVAATVRGMLGSGADADDVGQEVFIRFYRSIEKFRGDAALKTYLTRIAINLSLNALKRRKRGATRFVDESVEELRLQGSDGRDDHDVAERQRLVHHALARLDEKHRAVVLLRMIEGYSTAETAEILEMPQGTVLSRLSRGMKKMEEILRPYVGDQQKKEVKR